TVGSPNISRTVTFAGGCPMVSWLQSYLYCAILPLPLYRPHVQRVTRFQAEGLGRGLYGVGHGMATLTSLTGRQLDGSFHEIPLPIRVAHPRGAGGHIGPLLPPLAGHSASRRIR